MSSRQDQSGAPAAHGATHHAALALAPCALLTWGADERLAGWDAAAARMFGFTAEEQVGRNCASLSLLEAGEAGRLRAALQRLAAGEKEVQVLRLRARTKSGEVLVSEWHNIRLAGAGVQADAILSFVLDVSRLASAEAELKRIKQQQDSFIAALSHELRDPLAPLRNAAYLLRSVAPEAQQRGEIVQLIERQIDQMARRLDRLLDVSRSTAAAAPTLLPVHLQLVVREAVEQITPRAEAAGQTLLRKVPSQPVRVRGDVDGLAQMVAALLDNAVKFTPPGGLIEVSLVTAGGNAVVTVKDNGQGIERERLQRLLQRPTARGSEPASESEEAGGSGLGLATVLALAAAHGGSLSASSDGAGRGASFSLTLPLLDGGTESRVGREPQRRPRLRVIVVDDNRDNADTLNTLLTMMGHYVRVGYDGAAALAAAAEPFDAIMLDVGLPDLDGYEVARRLRAGGTDRPLIAISGYGQARDKERAMAAGFDRHLTKPVSIRDVVNVLDEVARGMRHGT